MTTATNMATATDTLQTNSAARPAATWGARRAQSKPEEKKLMAQYYANHDFLVQEGLNPETKLRETVASILVNQGTTPNIVVYEALQWIERSQSNVSYDLTWYTPGHLIPTTLHDFRKSHPHLLPATQLFLFPGKVDHNIEAVSGPDAGAYVESLKRHFTYAILSANSFDVQTGTVYFHLPEECRLQRACATRYAAHKFLFVDSSKFKSEGEIGYRIDEMLSESEAVTIYTVSSEKDEWIKAKFKALCDKILGTDYELSKSSDISNAEIRDLKSLRLRIVGTGETATDSLEEKGFLKDLSQNRAFQKN